jgi:putative acetyltransferase
VIRAENIEDAHVISSILKEAFYPSENEAKLVGLLRRNPLFNPQLSLLALAEKDLPVGHILFFPVSLITNMPSIQVLALCPLAVRTNFQRKGYGTKLVQEGIKRARELGYLSVFVVGSTEYYGRFGFQSVENITHNLGDFDKHFMSLELKPNGLRDEPSLLTYPPEFDIVK